jgi:spermidine synthase
VIPNVVIERVDSPGGELVLSRRENQFSIRVAGVELMNSHNHWSEDELGRLTSAQIADIAAPRVLIGGLGMGYTLRAALDQLPREAHVDIVEIVPDVIRWNHGVLADLAQRPLDDARVTVIEDDVANVLRSPPTRYHAILLDVDNGPDGVYRANTALYKRAGLVAMHAALQPRGVLAVWSSFESATFTKWLREVGFAVDVVTIRAKYKGGPRHYIWFARRP